VSEETKPVCPRCGTNDLVIQISNGWHCNRDATDFGVELNPIAAQARRAREQAVGFPSPAERNHAQK